MVFPQNEQLQLQQAISSAKEILIITPGKPPIDTMAASLALYLSLPNLGKQVSVVSPEPMTVDVGSLVGIDKVKSSLGNKNFIISLDYTEGSIEKVSYNIEGNKFNLVIEPRPGFSFSKDKVDYNYSGTNADLFIVVGVARLASIGKFMQYVTSSGKSIINIDNHRDNERFGKINLVYPGSGSVSEIVTSLLKQLGLPVDGDTATNLFSGLISATNSFTSPKTTPDSFEMAALLLRHGARNSAAAGLPQESYYNQNQAPGAAFGLSPLPQPGPNLRLQQASEMQATSPAAPPDWLKPKIFRSQPGVNPPPGYVPTDGKGSLS